MKIHNPLPANSSSYIPGDQIIQIVESNLRKQVTVNEIVIKLKEADNNFNFHPSTVRKYMRKKLGYRFRKPKIFSVNLNEINYQILISIHIKLFLNILAKGYSVCWFDESKIELKNHKFKVWCNTHSRKYNFQPTNRSSTNLLLAVTSDGFLHWNFESKSIDSKNFKKYFGELISENEEENTGKLVYYLDNATPHRSKETKSWMEDKKIKVFYGAPYMSNLNLAEYIFKRIKVKLYKQYFSNM